MIRMDRTIQYNFYSFSDYHRGGRGRSRKKPKPPPKVKPNRTRNLSEKNLTTLHNRIKSRGGGESDIDQFFSHCTVPP